MVVIKRDGRKVEFDKGKIRNAILGAFADLDELTKASGAHIQRGEAEEVATKITDDLSKSYLQNERDISVEAIQDDVETALMSEGEYEVAKAYIRYRYLHDMARNRYSELMDAVMEKVSGSRVENQNANIDEHSFGGRTGEATRVLMRHLALNYLMSPLARERHENNEIYIHDLDQYMVGNHNCLTIPFDDLLARGFNTRQTDVRPANSVSTAFQLLAVIFQLQSLQQFGGVSAGHLDWTMVPYVRKSFFKHYRDGMKYLKSEEIGGEITNATPIDAEVYKALPDVYDYAMDMTEREIYQAVEGMYHNLNTLQSRSGNQLPFTSINYGTCTKPEGRMVTKALLVVLATGIGRLHKTSIFPCGIFQYMKGVNDKPGTPNYDLKLLALKATAQRLYPNYANVDWSGNAGYDIDDPRTYFSTMGCRTANGWDINGLGQLKDGRGNICPVTVILPTLAMQVKEISSETDIVEEFMRVLDKRIGEAKDILLERFDWICKQDSSSAKFMYENGLMAGYVPEEGIRSALKHGTLAIGQLGLAEALQILIGKDHTTEEGMELAKRIEQLFKDRCAQYKEQYMLNFGVYYTPAENLCYTAMKKFQQRYGEIPNVSDREFFTNSIHVPVWVEVDPFQKIDIEAQLTGYSSAGCITYVELDSGVKNNIDALETIVDYAMAHDVPYFAVNVPNDQCMSCGYCDEIGPYCPMCNSSDIQRLRRVTGYLTGDYKTAFNKGKQQETEMRVKHQRFNK